MARKVHHRKRHITALQRETDVRNLEKARHRRHSSRKRKMA